MTPLALSILLHHHYRLEPWPYSLEPTSISTTKKLVEEGFLFTSKSGSTFITTQKGCAYVAALTKVPYPTQVWQVIT